MSKEDKQEKVQQERTEETKAKDAVTNKNVIKYFGMIQRKVKQKRERNKCVF